MSLLSELIDNCYAAQKRTGRNRQFVFFRGDKVYKGPYPKSKMELILARSKQLSIWGDLLVIQPSDTIEDFIIFPNIAEDYDIVNYEVNKESFSDYSYKVAERVGVYKMNNVLADNKWIYDSPDLIEALVRLWILNVGDTGIFNILVDVEDKMVWIIDYDETSTEVRDDHLFYFSKHPAAKFKWYENMKKHYVTVAERLKKLEYEDTDKVKQAIYLLLKHSGCSQEHLMRTINTGKMAWHGLLGGTITYSGFKLDEVKSGLQKYIRRGMRDKALQCAFEFYRLTEITDNIGVITNLYNRLKIIAVEDVSLAGYNVVIEVLRIINEENREPEVLVAIVESLAKSKKTRICSHANAVYRNPIGRKYSRKQGIKVDRGVTDEDLLFIKENRKKYPFCDIYDESLLECSLMLYKRITEDDLNSVAWFANYEKSMPEKIKLRYAYRGKKTTNPIVHIFEVLELLGDVDALEIIRKAYFTIGTSKRDDKKYFIIFAILSVMYELKYKKKTLSYKSDVNKLLNGEYELELDEYVYDKHTARGSHKGRETFVTEGAHIENEDMNFHVDDLVEIYTNYI